MWQWTEAECMFLSILIIKHYSEFTVPVLFRIIQKSVNMSVIFPKTIVFFLLGRKQKNVEKNIQNNKIIFKIIWWTFALSISKIHSKVLNRVSYNHWSQITKFKKAKKWISIFPAKQLYDVALKYTQGLIWYDMNISFSHHT